MSPETKHWRASPGGCPEEALPWELVMEREYLLHSSRAIAVRCHGAESRNVMYLDQELHLFYLDRIFLLPDGVDKVESKLKSGAYRNSAIRVSMKLNGVIHPYTMELLSQFATFDFLDLDKCMTSYTFFALVLVVSFALCVSHFIFA